MVYFPREIISFSEFSVLSSVDFSSLFSICPAAAVPPNIVCLYPPESDDLEVDTLILVKQNVFFFFACDGLNIFFFGVFS